MKRLRSRDYGRFPFEPDLRPNGGPLRAILAALALTGSIFGCVAIASLPPLQPIRKTTAHTLARRYFNQLTPVATIPVRDVQDGMLRLHGAQTMGTSPEGYSLTAVEQTLFETAKPATKWQEGLCLGSRIVTQRLPRWNR